MPHSELQAAFSEKPQTKSIAKFPVSEKVLILRPTGHLLAS